MPAYPPAHRPPSTTDRADPPVAPTAHRRRYAASGVLLLLTAAVLVTGLTLPPDRSWARSLPAFFWSLAGAQLVTGVLLLFGRRAARGAALALSAVLAALAVRYLVGCADPDYLAYLAEYPAGGWFPIVMAALLLAAAATGAPLATVERPRPGIPDTARPGRDRRHRAGALAALAAGGVALAAALVEAVTRQAASAPPTTTRVRDLLHPPAVLDATLGTDEWVFLTALLGAALLGAALLALRRLPSGRGAVLALAALTGCEAARYLLDFLVAEAVHVDLWFQSVPDVALVANPAVVAILCYVALRCLAASARPLPPPPRHTPGPPEPRDAVPGPLAAEPYDAVPETPDGQPRDAPPPTGPGPQPGRMAP